MRNSLGVAIALSTRIQFWSHNISSKEMKILEKWIITKSFLCHQQGNSTWKLKLKTVFKQSTVLNYGFSKTGPCPKTPKPNGSDDTRICAINIPDTCHPLGRRMYLSLAQSCPTSSSSHLSLSLRLRDQPLSQRNLKGLFSSSSSSSLLSVPSDEFDSWIIFSLSLSLSLIDIFFAICKGLTFSHINIVKDLISSSSKHPLTHLS